MVLIFWPVGLTTLSISSETSSWWPTTVGLKRRLA